MANIFANQKEYVEKHKRNTFDLSFTNNLTFDFGDLVPVFCKEVIPGDSFSILPSFGLRLMPLVFPIQTRMNANLHFFYVRNRNLWKDWPDFIGRTKPNLVPPYLSRQSAITIGTGSLADYLGCPTTLIGDYGNRTRSYSGLDLVDNAELDNNIMCLLPAYSGHRYTAYGFLRKVDSSLSSLADVLSVSVTNASSVADNAMSAISGFMRFFITPPFSLSTIDEDPKQIQFIQRGDVPITSNRLIVAMWVKHADGWYPDFILHSLSGGSSYFFEENSFTKADISTPLHSATKYFFNKDVVSELKFQLQDPVRYPNVVMSYSEVLDYLRDLGTDQVRLSICSRYYSDTEGEYFSGNLTGIESDAFSMLSDVNGFVESVNVSFKRSDGIVDIKNAGALNAYTKVGTTLKVSSLPFRAYDAIYNCFYRNQFNDPFILHGVKEYNKFIRSDAGGEDSLQYHLYKRNYELDFLTSARQSPVDGDITPLVGVNASGKFTFKNADATTYTVTPIIGEDGHTLTGIESMEGTPENNSGLRRLMDMISLGISINDFRNVNALQRWLETNLRRGYRYKDQIMSHFGVDISYEELDMPEFIGGMSEPIIVNQINQSVDQTGNSEGLGEFSKVLGSYAGQASIMAQSKHRIKKYCDEHGFIIGILSVTPVPCYSQLLPKYLLKNNVLDYYFPEFGHIGNQPITYREVCPLQVFAAGDSLDDPFGYQRPWYDYLASVDEIHGDFRTTLNGFLITRLFSSKPELGKKFIEVDKDAMTNPFSVTDETNKILGQLYFDVSAQRPIPKYGIPRLEA